jgi:hypothetical protein
MKHSSRIAGHVYRTKARDNRKLILLVAQQPIGGLDALRNHARQFDRLALQMKYDPA